MFKLLEKLDDKCKHFGDCAVIVYLAAGTMNLKIDCKNCTLKETYKTRRAAGKNGKAKTN